MFLHVKGVIRKGKPFSIGQAYEIVEAPARRENSQKKFNDVAVAITP